MKKIFAIFMIFMVLFTMTSFAKQGNNGYEGGIASGDAPSSNSYDYREIVFITGKPVLFSGKVVVTRSEKTDIETITYRYTLSAGENDRLNRTVILNIDVEDKNNQKIRKGVLKSKPYERITIDGKNYTLDTQSNVDLSMSTITDNRPASDYFAGNWSNKKTYKGEGAQTITVTSTGKLYGYEQHWGSADVQEINMRIDSMSGEGDDQDEWGGAINIKISSTSSKRLLYMQNTPHEISFEGGYLQKQENNSILQYTAHLPEFDSENISTDRMITYRDEISLQSFPQQERLVVPDLKKIKGHWYEKDVKELYSLEILDDTEAFKPNQYMTRAEFAKAIILAGKIPFEQEEKTKRPSRRNSKEEEKISPYQDVPLDHPYFKYIYPLYSNGTMSGTGNGNFSPDSIINRAEALTIFVRMLGFESIAPNPTAVTRFRDNDQMPDWSRNSVAVASHIGLVRGDEYGYLYPNKPMTKAEAAAFLNRFIIYMRHDIMKDYRDRVMTY